MAQPPPIVHALVVADNIHVDDQTRKAYVLGTRYEIESATFPYSHPLLAVYVALGSGRGEVNVKVRIVDIDDEQDDPLAEQEAVAPFVDPLGEVEISLYFQEVIFQAPGIYRVQLLANNEFLHERRLSVESREMSGES